MAKQYFKWTPPIVPPSTKKVVVYGSPKFDDQGFLNSWLDKLTYWFSDVLLVHGGQKCWSPSLGKYVSPDYLAQNWAFKKWYTVVDFTPNYEQFGKNAESIRNDEMVQYASVIILFWDGKTNEVLDIVSSANKYKKQFRVIRYKHGTVAGKVYEEKESPFF